MDRIDTICDPLTTRQDNNRTRPGLAARATLAARRARETDPDTFEHRHTDWPQWTRRATMAHAIATALNVPIDTVTVTDDPDRRYGLVGQYPGHLITITDPDTAHRWQFIPDPAAHDHGWLFLDECPGCGGTNVPIARVATLADLGDYLDLDNDERFDHLPAEFNGDPGHRANCLHSPLTDLTT